jgi:Flp pilus assembly secretin CpaC
MKVSTQFSPLRPSNSVIGVPILFLGLVFSLTLPMEATEIHKLMVGKGHTEILDFAAPIKRVSIADPEIADATVTSPKQVIVNGKAVGATTMIVWDEGERYDHYRLVVHSENSYNQVMLRVRIAEVDRSAFKELGVNLLVKNIGIEGETIDIGSFAGKVNTPSDPLHLDDNVDFFLAVPTRDISAIVKALEEKKLLTMLARPNLSAINGSEASFLAGGEIPVPIFAGVTGQVTIEYKEFGIKLNFLPTVLDSELVNIKVATEVSSLDFENGIILSGFRIPALISRKTETTVEIKDGDLFAIGGLITSDMARTVSRIPVIGNIPVLGYLFSSHRFINNESELLIMISPHIVHAMREENVPELRTDG